MIMNRLNTWHEWEIQQREIELETNKAKILALSSLYQIKYGVEILSNISTDQAEIKFKFENLVH